MRFHRTAVEGAVIVELDAHSDARGSFARTFCEEEFSKAGIHFRVAQVNFSRNTRKGTLRGMHYQAEPHGEPKIVQCVRGRIFDVAIDLRPKSATYKQWTSVELSGDGTRVFCIPKGCAHGFLTLEDESDIVYLMGAPYVAASGMGVRWNDPAFGVIWPEAPVEISERDRLLADYRR